NNLKLVHNNNEKFSSIDEDNIFIINPLNDKQREINCLLYERKRIREQEEYDKYQKKLNQPDLNNINNTNNNNNTSIINTELNDLNISNSSINSNSNDDPLIDLNNKEEQFQILDSISNYNNNE